MRLSFPPLTEIQLITIMKMLCRKRRKRRTFLHKYSDRLRSAKFGGISHVPY